MRPLEDRSTAASRDQAALQGVRPGGSTPERLISLARSLEDDSTAASYQDVRQPGGTPDVLGPQ